jgi:hypothetical protein
MSRQYTHIADTPLILSGAERARLKDILSRPVVSGRRTKTAAEKAAGVVSPKVRLRARILLMLADAPASSGCHNAAAVAAACRCCLGTVHRLHRCFTAGGLDAALTNKTFTYVKLVTPAMAAQILALSRTPPPAEAGKKPRWTLARLTQAVIDRGIADHISFVTVSRILRAARPS